jgi:cation transport protein ChaC
LADRPALGRSSTVPALDNQPLIRSAVERIAHDGHFWVFGYGSLMWNPGFPYEEQQPAVLDGFHRRFCIRSTIYRGTPEQPGLVLGVDSGGECHGIAFKVAGGQRDAVLEYLFEREMRTHVYAATWVSLRIGEQTVPALTFVVQRDHRQYVRVAEDEMVRIIASCAGENGSNFEYLRNTVHALHELGVPDPELDVLYERVSAHLEGTTCDPVAASRTNPEQARSP